MRLVPATRPPRFLVRFFFDKDAFTSAQTRLIEAEHRQRLAQRDILAEVLGSMTPEERAEYILWRGPPRPAAQSEPNPK